MFWYFRGGWLLIVSGLIDGIAYKWGKKYIYIGSNGHGISFYFEDWDKHPNTSQ